MIVIGMNISKKGLSFLEYGEFKSTTSHGLKRWPSSSSHTSTNSTVVVTPAALSSSSLANQNQQILPRTTVTTMTTVRQHIEEKRRQDSEIACQALKLAETNIDNAMDFVRCLMSMKFLERCSW